jgi:hypothetical protein
LSFSSVNPHAYMNGCLAPRLGPELSLNLHCSLESGAHGAEGSAARIPDHLKYGALFRGDGSTKDFIVARPMRLPSFRLSLGGNAAVLNVGAQEGDRTEGDLRCHTKRSR